MPMDMTVELTDGTEVLHEQAYSSEPGDGTLEVRAHGTDELIESYPPGSWASNHRTPVAPPPIEAEEA